MGGLTPLRASPRLYSPPQEGVPWAWAIHNEEHAEHPFGCGAIPKRATLWGCFPWSNPPQMAPLILGLLGFARSIPSHSRSCIHIDYLFTYMFFFRTIVLRRNQITKEVVLVEASSILPLPRRLGSYWDKFS